MTPHPRDWDNVSVSSVKSMPLAEDDDYYYYRGDHVEKEETADSDDDVDHLSVLFGGDDDASTSYSDREKEAEDSFHFSDDHVGEMIGISIPPFASSVFPMTTRNRDKSEQSLRSSVTSEVTYDGTRDDGCNSQNTDNSTEDIISLKLKVAELQAELQVKEFNCAAKYKSILAEARDKTTALEQENKELKDRLNTIQDDMQTERKESRQVELLMQEKISKQKKENERLSSQMALMKRENLKARPGLTSTKSFAERRGSMGCTERTDDEEVSFPTHHRTSSRYVSRRTSMPAEKPRYQRRCSIVTCLLDTTFKLNASLTQGIIPSLEGPHKEEKEELKVSDIDLDPNDNDENIERAESHESWLAAEAMNRCNEMYNKKQQERLAEKKTATEAMERSTELFNKKQQERLAERKTATIATQNERRPGRPNRRQSFHSSIQRLSNSDLSTVLNEFLAGEKEDKSDDQSVLWDDEDDDNISCAHSTYSTATAPAFYS